MWLRTVLALAMTCAAAQAAAIQWTGPGSNGHFYDLTARESWTDAEAEAVARGGYLVTITSQAEQDFVVANLFNPAESRWIGLEDEATAFDFHWVDGEPFVYSAWAPGQPDDQGGVERNVNLYAPAGGLWNDANGTLPRVGIIEFNSDPSAPEPSAWILAATGLAAVAARRKPHIR